MERQRMHELLGAPTVVYRHQPSHQFSKHEAHEPSLDPFNQRQAWQERLHVANRIRSRCYYEVDQVFRTKEERKKRKLLTRKQHRRRTHITSHGTDDDICDDSSGEDLDEAFWDNSEFLDSRIRPMVLQSRRELLSSDPDRGMLLKRYKLLDHPYIPSQSYSVKHTYMKGSFYASRSDTSRDLCMERRKADLSYLAPFTSSVLFDDSAQVDETRGTQNNMEHTRSLDETSAQVFGNCLVCIPCPCCGTSWVLIHRVAKNLTRVRVSNLTLPQASHSKSKPSKDFVERRATDVGNIILEIAECGQRYIVVRTVCSVVLFLVAVYESAFKETGSCSGACLKFVTRIDLESFSVESLSSLDVACHPKYGNDLAAPKFAVLSRSIETGRNFIHHSCGIGRPTRHSIDNLRNIEIIDFSNFNPMILWSAATSYVRPALVEDKCTKRFAFGHGSSLFTIDLRCNEGTFQWSPSQTEFVTEGIHSISGIHTDWSRPSSVWVSSSSAGKVWEIDSRMPCQSLTCWSMPGVVKDNSTVMLKSGLHGSESLFVQPSCRYDKDESVVAQPMLVLEKNYGNKYIELYQRPESGPRFQTSSLESAPTPSSTWSFGTDSSIALSSVFPLVDSSDDVFACGLACFRTQTSNFLNANQLEELGLSKQPGSVLCAITSTSIGDIYAHTLLACSGDENRRSIARRNLPIGCSLITIPQLESTRNIDKFSFDTSLAITMSNNTTETIDKHLSVVSTRSDCRHFSALNLEKIPTHCAESQLLVEPDMLETITHPESFTVGHENSICGVAQVKVGRTLINEGFGNPLDLVGVKSTDPTEEEIGRSDLNSAILKAHNNSWIVR